MDELAGVLDRRAEALIIDGLLVAVVVGALGYLVGTAVVGGSLGGLGVLFLTLEFGVPIVFLVYQAAFEGYYGQTLGKRARGIVVVKDDGSQCTWGAAIVRNLLRVVDMLPVFYLVGIVSAYVTDDHQRVGDFAASTVVVQAE